MKKLISKALFIIFMFGMIVTLILNVIIQFFSDIKMFEKISAEYFYQISNLLEDNDKKLEEIKEEFAETCIIRARAAAYIAQQNPEMVENREKCGTVATLLQVDELHFFDKNGVIYAGTHPEYYGISVWDGEQIGFFAPMLEDSALELCQDITPNTAEEKKMQYAAVWCSDGEKIVQVGLNPERVLKAIENNDISDMFALISCEKNSTFYAVDVETNEILGSTNARYVGKNAAQIGLKVYDVTEELDGKFQMLDGKAEYCVAQRSGSRILVHSIMGYELFSGMMRNMVLLCGYIIAMFLLLLAATYSFLERKIIRSIVNINAQMKKIEQGNYEETLSDESTEEFTQLCHSINSMTKSLLNFTGKISKALELSEVPIGICECNLKRRKLTVTSRVKDILKLTDEEYAYFLKHPELLEEKRQDWFCADATLGPHVYRLKKHRDHFVRIEVFSYDESTIAVMIDITADILEKNAIEAERDTDMLTGLYNRRAFYRMMDSIVQNPEERRDAAIILCDLDHLKKVNDEYGHLNGNRYIQAFSDLLHSCKAEKKIAARMGGDEFLLVVYGLEGEKEAENVADWLLSYRDVSKVAMDNGQEIMLEFSLGYAYYGREFSDYQELEKQADARMYEDKKRRSRHFL